MAKRRTWAINDPDEERSRTAAEPVSSSAQLAPPKPARTNLPSSGDCPNSLHKPPASAITSELHNKLGLWTDPTPSAIPGASNENTANSTSSDSATRSMPFGSKIQPNRSEKGPTASSRNSSYDNVILGGHPDRKRSPTDDKPNKEIPVTPKPRSNLCMGTITIGGDTASPPVEPTWKSGKEGVVTPKPRPNIVTPEASDAGDTPAVAAIPPWKASLSQRAGKLRVSCMQSLLLLRFLNFAQIYFTGCELNVDIFIDAALWLRCLSMVAFETQQSL